MRAVGLLRRIGSIAGYLNAAAYLALPALLIIALVGYNTGLVSQFSPRQPLLLMLLATPLFTPIAYIAVLSKLRLAQQLLMAIPMCLSALGAFYMAWLGAAFWDTSDMPYAGEGLFMLAPFIWGLLLVMLACAAWIGIVGAREQIWLPFVAKLALSSLLASAVAIFLPFLLIVPFIALAVWWASVGHFLVNPPVLAGASLRVE